MFSEYWFCTNCSNRFLRYNNHKTITPGNKHKAVMQCPRCKIWVHEEIAVKEFIKIKGM